MKKTLLLILFLFSHSFLLFAQNVISNRMIWKGRPYAAFTSLAYYKGFFYCAFREANKHCDTTGKDCGIIIIIRSKNTVEWETHCIYKENGYDLRDPQITVTPDNKLILLIEKCQYRDGIVRYRQTCTAFIDVNGKSTSLSPIEFKTAQKWNWVWNIQWIDGEAYGFTYEPFFSFVKSKDGRSFEMLQKIDLEGMPTEASVIKLKRNIYLAVVRRKGNSLLGLYYTRKKQWDWVDIGMKIECPKLIKINGKVYLFGRGYADGVETVVYGFAEKDLKFKKVLGFKGNSDCAYPGVVYKNRLVYITYYSGDGKQGDIYLAKINMEGKIENAR